MVDKDTMGKEMEVLLAEKEIKVNDKTVVVKRFSFLDAIRLASHTSAIIAEVINDSEKTAGAVTRLMFNSGNEKEDNVIRITGFVELLSIVGDEGVELLKEIMVKSTNMDEEEITLETTFVDDLGADSLDVFQIIMGLEEEFDIEIANEAAEKIVTVGDAVDQIKNASNN